MPSQPLDFYFERTGWGGATASTLATLSGLLAAHMRAIPFENLDVLAGRPIRVDIAALREKLVDGRRGGKASDAWVSTLEADHPVDFEIANHFTATHPDSPFRNRLMLSRCTENGRVSVINRDVTIRRGPQKQTFQLADRAALRSLLTEHFGLDYEEVDRLRMPFIPEWC
jgi:arylamine N-acetyltransferase